MFQADDISAGLIGALCLWLVLATCNAPGNCARQNSIKLCLKGWGGRCLLRRIIQLKTLMPRRASTGHTCRNLKSVLTRWRQYMYSHIESNKIGNAGNPFQLSGGTTTLCFKARLRVCVARGIRIVLSKETRKCKGSQWWEYTDTGMAVTNCMAGALQLVILIRLSQL